MRGEWDAGFSTVRDVRDWNFGKFLVDGGGKPVKRYAPEDSPLSIASDIEALL